MVSRVAALAVVVLSVGCGHHKAAPKPKQSDLGRGHVPYAVSKLRPVKRDDGHPPSLPSHLIAEVPDKTVGPTIARHDAATVVAYIGSTEGGLRRVVGIPLAADGTPGSARLISGTGPDSTTLVVRAAGGTADGFVAAWTDLTERGEALSVVGVGADASPLGVPVEVARTPNDIVWVEIVPTARGSVCVWAEETRGGDANVLAVALEPAGKPRGVPSRVVRGVVGWQAVATGAGAALAIVSPTPGAAPTKAGVGPHALSWLRLDPDAQPLGAPAPIATSPAPIVDVDIARVADRYVLAWTDRSGLDPEVALATVDLQGKATPVRPATRRSGGAGLAGVAGGAHGGLLAWEETSKRAQAMRRLHLVRLDATGSPDEAVTATVEIDGSVAPEIEASEDGFGLLVRAQACADPPAPRDPPCAQGSWLPTFVRLDGKLEVAQVEPMRLEDARDPAGLAWGLACPAGHCLALAARPAPVPSAGTRVSAVDLAQRASRYRAPLAPRPDAEAPHVAALSTLAAGDRIAEVAAARVGDATLLATMSASLEAASGKAEAGGATIAVRVVDDTGETRGLPVTLTTRALPTGGVAIAAARTPDDGAAIAWVARDDGDPEVHVTRVDRRGKRVRDVRLTMTKGDASDVAVAWGGSGWLLAWVDARDGNGEVYEAKVGLDLQRLSRDERITDAPGDASDVALLGGGEGAWLAWADPRESPRDGFADVYVAHLRADARPDVTDTRVLATAAHSRSPALAPGSADASAGIAWIEEAPLGADPANSGAYGAMFGELDGKGRLIRDAVRSLGAGDGYPSAVAVDRAGVSLRAVIARGTRDELVFDTLDLSAGRPPRAYPLFRLDGPPSLDVSVSLLGDVVYFNDDGPDPGDGRARRALIAWKR
jgi:hypothetical protein